MRYKVPKGTHDILPADIPQWMFVEQAFRELCAVYGYEELRTPIFERTEVFTRGIGETSDIVTKEMYQLQQRGDYAYALKPEGTAAAVRALVEHHLGTQGSATRLFYITPIFRYENPQKARFRQSHQVGVELFGAADALADAEVIALTAAFYDRLGIKDIELRLNSVGTPQTRPAYRAALLDFVRPHMSGFPADYVARLERNPMRLLDSKDPDIKAIISAAPDIFDYLDDESRAHFDQVAEYLSALGIPFTRDRFLVRGLDYYTRTAFEVVSGQLGAQDSLCGGGRYDGLVEELGGDPTPAVGVAMGIERALAVMVKQGFASPLSAPPCAHIVMLGNVRPAALRLLQEIRGAGLAARIEFGAPSLKAQMRRANESSARYAVILGEDELARNTAAIKNLQTGEQQEVALDQVVSRLRQ